MIVLLLTILSVVLLTIGVIWYVDNQSKPENIISLRQRRVKRNMKKADKALHKRSKRIKWRY